MISCSLQSFSFDFSSVPDNRIVRFGRVLVSSFIQHRRNVVHVGFVRGQRIRQFVRTIDEGEKLVLPPSSENGILSVFYVRTKDLSSFCVVVEKFYGNEVDRKRFRRV